MSERDPLNVAHDLMLQYVRRIASYECTERLSGCVGDYPCTACDASQTLALVEKLEPWEFDSPKPFLTDKDW